MIGPLNLRAPKAVRHRLLSVATQSGGWLGRASYLQKWLVLGTVIGIVAGLGAVVFFVALTQSTQFFLEFLGGYTPPSPSGEGGHKGDSGFSRPWAIPLVVGLGGLLSGIIVFTLAPEAEGHGTDAAIEAVNKNPRMIRMRAVLVKLVASAITIGSGGSAGREGPTAQISAGFGSLLARTLDLAPRDGRIAVAVGIGSGIGAIFGAPLGGALLCGAIVYKDDFEFEAIIPGLFTSIVSYTVYGAILGFEPLFGFAGSDYRFDEPLQLAWFALIGILAGFIGLLFARTFYFTVGVTHRLPGSPIIKPAIGGVLVGLLALGIPEILGSGYGWVQQGLDRTDLLAMPLWLILVLPIAKIVATSLSIGTGGSGGIFGPGLVIGAFTGAAVWRVLEPIAPAVPDSPAPFVIVGMMACFGAIARVPLAVMLMVAEMTGGITILAPAMIAVGLAYLIVRASGDTIYRAQLQNRDEAQAARMQRGMPLLGGVTVASVLTEPRLVLSESTRAAAAFDSMSAASVPGAPVVDEHGRFVGAVFTDVLSTELQTRKGDTSLGRWLDASAPTVAVAATLADAVDALPDGHRWLTVVDDQRLVRGIVGVREIVHGYRTAVQVDVERFGKVSANADLIDVRVGETSTAVGRELGDNAVPDGVIVVSILRGDSVLPGAAAVALHAGDIVTLLGHRTDLEQVRAMLA
ncbi:chloride channel protein [Antrihabitans sp. YC3-6]|uniref:Chloride channel protein n=2 Tax=Antrihabitans stalagmiti TaxID=2799499 RepID=A0A934U6K0_9NOCA|nr:chloride channel protein [Antrihabitans stalagmiti]